jgi:hypothetical protein
MSIRHAPKKAGDESSGETGSKPPSQAQVSFAEKIAREKGLVIPDETKGSSAAVSAWIASNLGTERRKGSQDCQRQQAAGINAAQIDSAKEEVTETHGRCR